MKKWVLVPIIGVFVGIIASRSGIDLSWLRCVISIWAGTMAILILRGVWTSSRKSETGSHRRRLVPAILFVISLGIVGVGILRTEVSVLTAMIPWIAFAFLVAAIVTGKRFKKS